MIRLTERQIVKIHSDLIAKTGGIEGIRDKGILDSAVNSPFMTFDGEDLYPTIQHKAAQLAFFIISNHPFIDGNKRIGLHVMLIFLELNGVTLKYTQNELIKIGLMLADGNMTVKDLLLWLIDHNEQ